MDPISTLKLADLKRELKARNLSSTGAKQVLVDRLIAAMSAKKSVNEDSNLDDLLDEDLLGEEESDSGSDENNVAAADLTISSPTTTVPPVSLPTPKKQESLKRASDAGGQNGTSANNDGSPPSKKKIILNRQPVPEAAPQVLPVASAETIAIAKAISESKEASAGATGEKAVIKLGDATTDPATDKLKLRQEKFKTELPSTADASDKLKKRAERFGVVESTGKTGKGAVVVSGEDAAKLAKRQERFGVTTSDKVNESKQRRAERFGLNEKSVASSANSAEVDEKKKLRAARFAAALSSS